MTDREMLELAAKAADRENWVWCPEMEAMQSPPRLTEYGVAHAYWSPLTDDGDALRLAVALKLDLHFEDQPEWLGELIEILSPEREDGSRHCTTFALGDDANAATRQAIVRAAAEIGRAMG